MGEKRRYMRFNILMDALFKRNEERKNLKINNFSREGVGIISDEYIDAGEDVELELEIPGDNIPVVINGEISWTNDTPTDQGKHMSGVKFKDIENSDRTRILHYIYEKWMLPKEEKTETE